MKLLLSALCLTALLGITRMDLQASAPTEPAKATADVTESPDETGAICPRLWTCDSSAFYALKSDCIAACSTVCYRDYACNGGCVCP